MSTSLLSRPLDTIRSNHDSILPGRPLPPVLIGGTCHRASSFSFDCRSRLLKILAGIVHEVEKTHDPLPGFRCFSVTDVSAGFLTDGLLGFPNPRRGFGKVEFGHTGQLEVDHQPNNSSGPLQMCTVFGQSNRRSLTFLL